MIKFKQFITEHKVAIDNLLDTHLAHAEAGIPLPDTADLYTKYKGGNVRYDKPEGGFVEHALNGSTPTITHFNDKEVIHRTDGPAQITPNYDMWSLDGVKIGIVGRYGEHNRYHDYQMYNHENGFFHGQHTDSLEEFNKHLTKNGFPSHKED